MESHMSRAYQIELATLRTEMLFRQYGLDKPSWPDPQHHTAHMTSPAFIPHQQPYHHTAPPLPTTSIPDFNYYQLQHPQRWSPHPTENHSPYAPSVPHHRISAPSYPNPNRPVPFSAPVPQQPPHSGPGPISDDTLRAMLSAHVANVRAHVANVRAHRFPIAEKVEEPTTVVMVATAVDEEGAKTVEAIEETIVAATAPNKPTQEVTVNDALNGDVRVAVAFEENKEEDEDDDVAERNGRRAMQMGGGIEEDDMLEAAEGFSLNVQVINAYWLQRKISQTYDRVDIIANDQGNRTTPFYVTFTDSERLIDDAAKNQVAMDPINTVFDAKRPIGRRVSDPSVQIDMKIWAFKVNSRPGEKSRIVVTYKREEKQFAAVEIPSMGLTKRSEIFGAYLGTTVKNTVITVPAYLTDQVENPWTVSAKERGKIDYDKLIDKFGCKRLKRDFIQRIQRVAGRTPNVFIRRGAFFAHRELNEILDAYENEDGVFSDTGWYATNQFPVDGCPIFWRTSKVKLLNEESIEFDKLGQRNNVVQICVRESVQQSPMENEKPSAPNISSAGSNRVVVCNIHFLYNPKGIDIKLGQDRVRFDKANAVSKAWNDAPVVICGDFNCTPKSPMYNYILEQKLDLSGLARDKESRQASAEIQAPVFSRPNPGIQAPMNVETSTTHARLYSDAEKSDSRWNSVKQ